MVRKKTKFKPFDPNALPGASHLSESSDVTRNRSHDVSVSSTSTRCETLTVVDTKFKESGNSNYASRSKGVINQGVARLDKNINENKRSIHVKEPDIEHPTYNDVDRFNEDKCKKISSNSNSFDLIGEQRNIEYGKSQTEHHAFESNKERRTGEVQGDEMRRNYNKKYKSDYGFLKPSSKNRNSDFESSDWRSKNDKKKSSSKICLKYEETKGNLFDAPEESSLAHCVAEDMQMGAGIAVEFRRRFKSTGYLMELGIKTGGVAVLKKNERFIYYLVTKRISTGKPTLESLRLSLQAMADHVKANNVKLISMPTIGSGLDRLDWDLVKAIIREIFSEIETHIVIYHYDKTTETPSTPLRVAFVKHIKGLLQIVGKDYSGTGLLYLSPIKSVTDEMRSLNVAFPFLHKCNAVKRIGEIVRTESDRKEIVYGLVCIDDRGNISYEGLEECMFNLRKILSKDGYTNIGIQATPLFTNMNYVVTSLKYGMDNHITIWVCWDHEIPKDF